MPTRRDGLARRRAAMGFTQESLAEHLGLERSTVGRWERGTMTPQPWNRPDLAKALDLSHDALADLLGPGPVTCGPAACADVIDGEHHNVAAKFTSPDWHQAGQACLLEPPWSITGTMQVLHKLAGGSVDRRGFLIITGVPLAGLGDRWVSALARVVPLPTALPEQPQDRLSTTVLDRLDNRLASLRRLDDEFGGRELHQLAVAEFRWLTHLADQVDNSSVAGQRLFTLVSEAARLCGWLHFDADHHAAAQSYYVAALRSSASANDSLTGAHVLACMSLQALFTGHPQEAVDLIDAAEEQARHAAVTRRLRALLASRKARAYAKMGDALSCGRSLNEAEHHLDGASPEAVEPDWIYFFDESEFAAQAASCWVDLSMPGKARPLIDNALERMDLRYVRDRAVYYARSARSYANESELEPACDDLKTAAGLARQTGSAHVIDTIREARQAISPYDGEPRVKKLDRHLAGLAA